MKVLFDNLRKVFEGESRNTSEGQASLSKVKTDKKFELGEELKNLGDKISKAYEGTHKNTNAEASLAKLKVKLCQGELLDVNPAATAAIARKR